MLFPHVVDLHAGQCTVRKSLFNSLARMIRVDMHLHDVFIRHDYNGISHTGQIILKLLFLRRTKFSVQHDNKLCTVSERNIRRFSGSGSHRFLHRSGNRLNFQIHFLTEKNIIGSLKNFQESLSAGIHNPGFF